MKLEAELARELYGVDLSEDDLDALVEQALYLDEYSYAVELHDESK